MNWIFAKISYMKSLLWAPLLYHSHDILWLNDLCVTILNFNAIQSFFFYSSILLILSFTCKNSLLSLFRQKLFFFIKNSFLFLTNKTALLNFFKNFNKLSLLTFIKNKFKNK